MEDKSKLVVSGLTEIHKSRSRQPRLDYEVYDSICDYEDGGYAELLSRLMRGVVSSQARRPKEGLGLVKLGCLGRAYIPGIAAIGSMCTL